jgi:hypothetical protein
LIAYPLLFGGFGIAAVVLLKRLYLREPLSDLNSGKGNLLTDALWGLALAAACFAVFFLAQQTLRDLLALRPIEELLGLMLDMRALRLLPLVLARALYDGVQVGAFLLTYPGG